MRFPRQRIHILAGVGMAALALVCAVGWLYPKSRLYAKLGYRRCANRLGLAAGPDFERARARVGSVLDSSETLPLPEARIVIRKADRRLDLFSGDRLVKTYPIGLGPHPQGHKERKGDGRTPEGRFFICTRLPKSKDHVFMGINYPAAGDAERGVKEGLLSAGQAEAIREAERNHQAPPWDTRSGGAIGIHGNGAFDWTAGCIALDDPDAEEIYVATAYWTPVEILP